MTTALAENLIDPAEELALLEGCDVLLTRVDLDALRTVRPLIRKEVWDTVGVLLDTFRETIERHVVREATPELAIKRFDVALHDIVPALLMGIDRLLLPNLLASSRNGEVEPIDFRRAHGALSARLVPLARKRVGRLHAEIMRGAILRLGETHRLVMGTIAAVANVVPASQLSATLSIGSVWAAAQGLGVRAGGLLLVCAMAIEEDPELPADAPTRAVLRGLCDAFWGAAYEHERVFLIWVNTCARVLEPQGFALPEEIRERIREGDSVERRFHTLLREWRWARGHLSDPEAARSHPAWAAIVMLGHEALPMILREMERGALDDWNAVLRMLTGTAPEIAPEARGDLDALRLAWIELLRRRLNAE